MFLPHVLISIDAQSDETSLAFLVLHLLLVTYVRKVSLKLDNCAGKAKNIVCMCGAGISVSAGRLTVKYAGNHRLESATG